MKKSITDLSWESKVKREQQLEIKTWDAVYASLLNSMPDKMREEHLYNRNPIAYEADATRGLFEAWKYYRYCRKQVFKLAPERSALWKVNNYAHEQSKSYMQSAIEKIRFLHQLKARIK